MQVERAVAATGHTSTVLGAPPQSNLASPLSAEWAALPTSRARHNSVGGGRRCGVLRGGRGGEGSCGEGPDISEL